MDVICKKKFDFEQIVKEIPGLEKEYTLKNINSKLDIHMCPDNYVGSLEVGKFRIKNDDLWFEKSLRNAHFEETEIKKIEALKKRIVIVLESPHKEEFQVGNKPLPALGKTGYNLQKYFIDIFNVCMEKSQHTVEVGEYDVILMNAIQYQCSLGQKPNRCRDRVWLYLWLKENLKEDFTKRLKIYNPDVIINLCTLGSHKNDFSCSQDHKKHIINKVFADTICKGYDGEIKDNLKEMVQKEIDEYSSKYMKNNKDKYIYLYDGRHPCHWLPNAINYLEK